MKKSIQAEKTGVEIEALTVLQGVLTELSKPDYSHDKDLETNLMKMSYAFRLLNHKEQVDTISKELQGYSSDDIPDWREVSNSITYEAHIVSVPDELKPHRIKAPMGDSVSAIIGLRNRWTRFANNPSSSKIITFKTKTKRIVQVKEVTTILLPQLDNILNVIRHVYYESCSSVISQLKYGQILESIFQQYKKAVDDKLSKLRISNQLEAVIHDISRDNPESWRNAVMGCRNILTDLANRLWQAPDKYYKPLNLQLKGLPLEPVKNKLRSWIHEKGIGQTEHKFIEVQLTKLADVINELYALDSKAKEQIEYQDALCCLINTYTLLGEIALRTDMQPITKVEINGK